MGKRQASQRGIRVGSLYMGRRIGKERHQNKTKNAVLAIWKKNEIFNYRKVWASVRKVLLARKSNENNYALHLVKLSTRRVVLLVIDEQFMCGSYVKLLNSPKKTHSWKRKTHFQQFPGTSMVAARDALTCSFLKSLLFPQLRGIPRRWIKRC